ncbi:MAG: sigma-54 dependent transcriptional regulator [Polyangiaceae bacterium]
MKRALVIEDDAGIRANIVDLLRAEGFEVRGAENGKIGLELALGSKPPDVVVCDVRMPELSGFEVLSRLRSEPATRAMPFIFLTAAAERAEVRRGMNLGADDYVTKPFTRAELLDAIQSRLARQEVKEPRARSVDAATRASTDDVIAREPSMQRLYEDARKAAAAPISVLILGETGVGKEILAHAIHRISKRRDKPFLALNCAALTETLLESELFGNERGAFTGAITARPGLFEAAEGGTVFLDELGELPMTIQVKLLRVLEERRVMRVGGRTPIPVDVRFVAATNRDLEAAIAKGTFREDLYFRLNGIAFEIPPLRARPTEILPFAERFVGLAADKLDRRAPRIAERAAAALERYSWPGNVRELKNVMERAVVLSADAIEEQHLPAKVTRLVSESASEAPPPSQRPPPSSRAPGSSPLRSEIDQLERHRIVEALEKCGGNQTSAAELLGMSRRTLVSRLSTYDLPRPRKRP